MTRWKVVSGLVAVAAATALCVGVAMAQQRGGGGGGFDPAQWQQRMADRMKETLAVTDDEWKVMGPLVEKVQTLSRQVRGGAGMRGMFGGGGGRMGRGGQGAPAQAAPQVPQSDVEKAAAALQTVLEDQASTTAQIKEKLTAYREAREKGRDDLAKAQEQLREVLNLRQEAQLVMMGLLD